MNENSQTYTVRIPLSELNKLRTNGKFILILKLSRYINQLSFCYKAYEDSSEDDSPVGHRQIYNAFLFSCGVLYEALKIVPPLGKEFKTYPSFKNGFGVLSKDKEMNFLKNNVLNKIRNGIVFHIDSEPIIETLKTLNLPQLDFISVQGDSYFLLADDIALNYIIGEHDSPETEKEYFHETIERIMKLSVKYIKFATELLYEYLLRKQWEIHSEAKT